ncbi:MAG: sulfatase-like hydrolase/transferase [Gammaproteobacteria bacterium]|nr:sulfatase-like hydrolase/transferase [Gammaproteobacteria bacterium]
MNFQKTLNLSETPWERLVSQFLKDFKFWVFAVLFFQLNRWIFIYVFKAQITTASLAYDIFAASLTGLRFDMRLAGGWTLLSFLLFTLPSVFLGRSLFSERGRQWFAMLFTATATIITVISYAYYAEYNDLFNEILFGLYYDDTTAIFKTILVEYHPIRNFLIILVVFAASTLCLTKWLKPPSLIQWSPGWKGKVFLILLMAGFFKVALQSGWTLRSIQLKDAAITQDEFLNKAVVPPPTALRYAIKHHWLITQGNGLKEYTHQPIAQEAEYYFGNHSGYSTLDDYMQRKAQGAKVPTAQLPTHIFLIVMESYHSWPLLNTYASLKVAENLKAFAKEGLYFKYFLPASSSTMSSLAAIMTGLPDAGVHINYLPNSTEPYPSSLATVFKKLGYKTRLFYGGYLSWQRLGDFAREQGFEEVYGANDIQHFLHTTEWGVDDESLFQFIRTKTNPEEREFTLVMTTGNHRPYTLNIPEFPLKEIPKPFMPTGKNIKNLVSLRSLTHFWESDRALGHFVRKEEEHLPRPLFAITGDHYGRDHVFANPPLYEASSVPFVLYGKKVLQNIKMPSFVAGSHIDMTPTLVELIAPKGFLYHTIGHDLLAKKSPIIGIGKGKIITPQFVLQISDFNKAQISEIGPVPGEAMPSPLPNPQPLVQQHNAAHAMAWWRARRGASL